MAQDAQKLRAIVKELRSQSALLAMGWDKLRVARLAHVAESVGVAIDGADWLEASGRADELAFRCSVALNSRSPADEVAYLVKLAAGLADCLAQLLTSGFDAAFMPDDPDSWTFLLLGTFEMTAVFDLLSRAGFGVVVIASIAELAGRAEIRNRRAIIVVDAEWLAVNPLHNNDEAIIVVALVNQDSCAIRLAALHSGARLLLDQNVSADSILTALCGLVWQPAQAYRVMIVDDNHALLELHTYVLQEAGFTVLAVQDPLLVENQIEDFDPEVLLLDIEMPGCLGTELVSLLRQKESRRLLPVIYLTGHDEVEYILAARRAGCDDFLHTPVSNEVLCIAVATAARKYRLIRQIERVRAQEREQFHHLRTAIDVHAIVTVTARDGTMIDVNDRFCQNSGYSRAQLLGRNQRIVKSDQHPAEFYSELWRTIFSGATWQGEICNQRKDGSSYWVYTSIVPVLDAAGVPEQFISIRTDISDVKEKEERLRRSQLFANIGTWDWNLQSDELLWSERVAPLFGYPAGVRKIAHDEFLSYVHPDDRQALSNQLRLCLEQEASYNIEYRCVWPDGGVRWLHERGDVVRDMGGKPAHLLGVVQDVSVRKLAEFAMMEARNVAENASRAKSEFLAGMSHELRTPLNAILGYAQLFGLNPRMPVEFKEQAREIERAGRHLLSLVEDLMDLARIESGKLELVMESVMLSRVIEESLAMLAPVAKRYGIELINQAELCKKMRIHADYVRLRQVLINLLANAIKYNRPQGEVRLLCIVQDDRVRINVSDIGPGIPLEKQARLFTAFDRLGAERGSIEGSGIGLNITKRIVESMEGAIGFESIMGKGSTFWVEFKVIGEDDQLAVNECSPVSLPEKSCDPSMRQLVLHIEDNPGNQRLMRQIFSVRKEQVLRETHSAELGIEIARAEAPALILMDINLPGMDGYAALKELRADPVIAHIPVVAVSSSAMKGDEARGLEAGFAAYVIKPLDIKRFQAILDEHLKK